MTNHPLWNAMLEALSHPEFTSTLGWMLAISMVVGAVLNNGGKRMLSWSAAIILSVSLTEQARWYYWLAHQRPDLAIQGTGITVICAVINVTGLFLGWLITYVAKKRARHERVMPRINSFFIRFRSDSGKESISEEK